MSTLLRQIQLRRDVAADWAADNPVLASGEIGIDTDSGRFKIGDDTTAWNDLAFSGWFFDKDYVGGFFPALGVGASLMEIASNDDLGGVGNDLYGLGIDITRGAGNNEFHQTSAIRAAVHYKGTGDTSPPTTGAELLVYSDPEANSPTHILQGIETVVEGQSSGDKVYGAQYFAQAHHGTGGTFNDVIGMDVASYVGPLWAVGRIFGMRLGVNVDGSVTDAFGLRFENWNGASVVNSDVIYADASVGIGATAKYFLRCLAAIPSYFAGKHTFDKTYTASGTTGDQTINKPSFSVNFAAGQSSLIVTNSFITENSLVLCTVQTNDAAALIKNAVPANGSVTIRLNAPADAETKVACLVVN